MSRLFAVLSLSFLMVGCEAIWEEDAADFPDSSAAPVVVNAPAVESAPSPAVAPVAAVEKAPAPAESGAKFSWEAPAAAPVAVLPPVAEAPKDPTKARIIEVRESLGLIAFVRSDRPSIKSLLQLIKEGKVMVVEVVSVNGTQVVANILPGQKNAPSLLESDIVGVASQGSIGGQ